MYAFRIVFIFEILGLSSAEPRVTLPSGTYSGQQLSTYNGVLFNSFKGIKIASAQRFQEGVPVPNSNSTYNATDFGPACYQDLIHFGFNVTMSEDCLYLNVYSPNLNDSLPVIVYIYGGIFITGDTNNHLPNYFMETRRVVVVTIAYRLAAFGFLYFDDPGYPANLGFRDQILALRWVQDNIKNFGGDPSRVTINGQGAGSASVATLMHSPLAKGLFIGAISESGVTSGRWTLQPRCTGLQRRNELARQAGCERYISIAGGSAQLLVECLQSLSPDDIIIATRKFDTQYGYTPFQPTVERWSVPNPVIAYFPWLNGTNSTALVPWISGVNSNEGVTLVTNQMRHSGNHYFIRTRGRAIFEYILPDLLLYRYLASNVHFVTRSIMHHYLTLPFPSVTNLKIQLITDGFFDYPLSRNLRTVRTPTYVYYFNYTQPNETQGVGDQGELKYIWPNSTQYLSIASSNNNDTQRSRDMVNAWIDFAYNQVANVSNVTWERYDYRKDQVLIIDNKGIRMGPNPARENNRFWQTLPIDDQPKTKFCNIY